jgi:ankyrin repeat protein
MSPTFSGSGQPQPRKDTGRFKGAAGDAMARAIARADLPTIVQLAERGFPLEDRNETGNTPLHYALVQKSDKAARQLLALGADVHASGKDGLTPVMMAALFFMNDTTAALLAQDASVLDDRSGNGRSPMDVAYQAQNRGAMDLMLQKLSPEAVQREMFIAIRRGDAQSLRFLVEKRGADVTVPDGGGVTAEETARLFGDAQTQAYIQDCLSRHAAENAVVAATRGLSRQVAPVKKIVVRKNAGKPPRP